MVEEEEEEEEAEEASVTEKQSTASSEVARWLWRAVVSPWLASAIAVVIPTAGAAWLFGQTFVSTSHAVPGWVFLVAVAFAGLFLVSLWFHFNRWRTRPRRGLLAIAPKAGLYWGIGDFGDPEEEVWTAAGTFLITNTNAGIVAIARATLVVKSWRWGIIPVYRSIEAYLPSPETLDPGQIKEQRFEWHFGPVPRVRGDIVARVSLFDQLEKETHTNWLRWYWKE